MNAQFGIRSMMTLAVLALAATATSAADGVTSEAMVVSTTEREAAQTVCRSLAEFRRAAGADFDALSKTLRPDKIDFAKKMVVVVRAGQTNAFGVKVRVTNVERASDGKSVTVHWQFKPYFGGAAPPEQPGNPTLAAVLDRFDGTVKFQRKNWRPRIGDPLPPSAPPSRSPVLGRW